MLSTIRFTGNVNGSEKENKKLVYKFSTLFQACQRAGTEKIIFFLRANTANVHVAQC